VRIRRGSAGGVSSPLATNSSPLSKVAVANCLSQSAKNTTIVATASNAATSITDGRSIKAKSSSTAYTKSTK
jgi:uncharacterized protein (DUF2336 family)